jgi:DNA repair protein RecO (recombination protein O)
MITEGLEAWVLHKVPSGDSSLRVTFFTEEKGVLTCLCKGGRAPKKQAVLQPFLPLWLAVDVRKDWYFVRHIEVQAAAQQIKGKALFAGLYVNEILYYALKPFDPQPELFEAYQQTMQGLLAVRERLAIEILLRRFEWALLKACGYSLAFGDATVEDYYRFVPEEGFIAADTGIPGTDILALSEGRLETLSVLKTAKFIMRQAIHHLLDGRELKSRALYPIVNRP